MSPCRALQVPGHPNPPAPPPSPVPAPSGLPSHVYSVSWPAQRALLTAPGSSWATVSLHPRVLFNLRPALRHSWRVKGLHIRRETMPTGPVVVSMAPVVVPGDVADWDPESGARRIAGSMGGGQQQERVLSTQKSKTNHVPFGCQASNHSDRAKLQNSFAAPRCVDTRAPR